MKYNFFFLQTKCWKMCLSDNNGEKKNTTMSVLRPVAMSHELASSTPTVKKIALLCVH